MNKQEKLIVFILVALLGVSFWWQGKEAKARAKAYAEFQATNVVETAEAVTNGVGTAGDGTFRGFNENANPELRETAAAPVAAEPEPEDTTPETTGILDNGAVRLTLTSRGGGIREAAMLEYKRAADSEKDDVAVLDFSERPALSFEGIAGFGAKAPYTLNVAEDGRSAVLSAEKDGLRLERVFTFSKEDSTGSVPWYEWPLAKLEGLLDGGKNPYRVTVTDRWTNGGPETLSLPARVLQLGAMGPAEKDDFQFIGVDSRRVRAGKRKVEYTDAPAQRFMELFGGNGGGGCAGAARIPEGAPKTASEDESAGAYDWVAVRSRFFAQVLTPSESFGTIRFSASRTVPRDGTPSGIETLCAGAGFDAAVLAPGATVETVYDYYVGPRKMANLRRLGQGQVRVTHLGFWRIFCEILLDILNLLHAAVPNYGIAIILLTALVRLLIHPLTKRQNESMKRMNAMQPKLKEVQALYKDDPQKLQRETMRLYGEYKVNPMSSCFPMLIQLPIFVAFFTMLRCAVELRFAGFLWISDLSMPENLFRETFGFGVNLLPILMAAAMYFQSKILPSGGDPQQQRMMAVMMPLMMLFFFYSSASGLCLYWGTSTLFAIIGMIWNKRKNKKPEEGDVEVIVPPKETRQMRRAKDRA